MKTLSILCFCLVVSTIVCEGQDLPDLKAFGKDIGFNTSFVINGIFNSQSGPVDLMYKKQIKDLIANRFGTRLTFYNNADAYSYGSQYSQSSNNLISLSFGREVQKQITKYWVFYYGMDFAPYFQSYTQSYTMDNIMQSQNKTREIGLRFSPFLGLRFAIHERLYLATEVMLNASFSKKNSSSKSYQISTQDYTTSEKDFNVTKFFITPASGIFIFYRF